MSTDRSGRRWSDRHPVGSFVVWSALVVVPLLTVAALGVANPRLTHATEQETIADRDYVVFEVLNDGTFPATITGATTPTASAGPLLQAPVAFQNGSGPAPRPRPLDGSIRLGVAESWRFYVPLAGPCSPAARVGEAARLSIRVRGSVGPSRVRRLVAPGPDAGTCAVPGG